MSLQLTRLCIDMLIRGLRFRGSFLFIVHYPYNIGILLPECITEVSS